MIDFLILALAVFRLTYMITEEDGPQDIFCRFREWVGVKYDEYNQPYGDNIFAGAISCFYCCSVWVAIFATILYFTVPLSIIAFYPFALSGAAMVVSKLGV